MVSWFEQSSTQQRFNYAVAVKLIPFFLYFRLFSANHLLISFCGSGTLPSKNVWWKDVRSMLASSCVLNCEGFLSHLGSPANRYSFYHSCILRFSDEKGINITADPWLENKRRWNKWDVVYPKVLWMFHFLRTLLLNGKQFICMKLSCPNNTAAT